MNWKLRLKEFNAAANIFLKCLSVRMDTCTQTLWTTSKIHAHLYVYKSIGGREEGFGECV